MPKKGACCNPVAQGTRSPGEARSRLYQGRREELAVSPHLAPARDGGEDSGAMAGKSVPLPDGALREMLSARGLRVTGPRISVLRELCKQGPPISHPELAERLAGQGLDRVTVYRNLLALMEAGLLVRTQLSDHVWRYELPQGGGATHGLHPHLVCTDCGSVECLPKAAVRLQGAAAQAQVSEVQLRGLCTDCRE